jgi:putative heme-binding domain-containing protein
VPAIFDVGPGSPTGVTFGYGARFPAKYQEAFFICDWSYGKLYALHLTPERSAYRGEIEEFVTGTPLPLTDVVINPADGAMYFTIGGRKTQSGLYRVRYVGNEPTAPSKGDDRGADFRALRHRLEAFHGRKDPQAVSTAWPYLGHEDRFIRFAARVALEHQDPATWRGRALDEKDPQKALLALLALVRVSASDPFHRKSSSPPVDAALKASIFQALERLEWDRLTDDLRIDLLRVWQVALNRLGPPPRGEKERLAARFDAVYPARSREQNAELCALLVYLEAPHVAAKTLRMMAEAPTQEEQLEYARSLRVLRTGWTLPERKEYFSWLLRAANYKGGNSFRGFLRIIKDDAVATLTDREKEDLKLILEAKPVAAAPVVGKPRPTVKNWKLDELAPLVEKGLGLGRRDFDRGRRLFGEATCFACHRFANEGGSQGPDLTGSSGRFSVRDLLESIVEPSKVISDQYAAVEVTTTDGRLVVGRIVNHSGDGIMINTNMLDPNAITTVNRKKVESMQPSRTSMMPAGLLDTLKEDEVLDLVAFLLSRGDRHHKLFKQ